MSKHNSEEHPIVAFERYVMADRENNKGNASDDLMDAIANQFTTDGITSDDGYEGATAEADVGPVQSADAHGLADDGSSILFAPDSEVENTGTRLPDPLTDQATYSSFLAKGGSLTEALNRRARLQAEALGVDGQQPDGQQQARPMSAHPANVTAALAAGVIASPFLVAGHILGVLGKGGNAIQKKVGESAFQRHVGNVEAALGDANTHIAALEKMTSRSLSRVTDPEERKQKLEKLLGKEKMAETVGRLIRSIETAEGHAKHALKSGLKTGRSPDDVMSMSAASIARFAEENQKFLEAIKVDGKKSLFDRMESSFGSLMDIFRGFLGRIGVNVGGASAAQSQSPGPRMG